MGKTALATNMAFSAAMRLIRDRQDGIDEGQSPGAGVAFFSLEMSADQLATRILVEQSGISSDSLRMGKISRDVFRNLARAAADLQHHPLSITHPPALSIATPPPRPPPLQLPRVTGLLVGAYPPT